MHFDPARLKVSVAIACSASGDECPEATHAERLKAKDFPACDQLDRLF
jgi:hypothetical protein